MRKCAVWIFAGLAYMGLAGCNLPRQAPTSTPSFSVTQAYTTISASLTQKAPTPVSATFSVDSTPSQTPAITRASETPPAPTASASPTSLCDLAAPGIPIDVTIPDDMQMQAGQSFTKIWRLRNAGSCTWTSLYSAALFSGEPMGAPASVPLGKEVPPGYGVDIAVDLVAPRKAGRYQGNWKLRTEDQTWFGIGPNGNSPFWVRIIVVPQPTLTPTPQTATPTMTPTPEIQASGLLTVTLGEVIDLDSLEINVETGGDLVYQRGELGQHLLAPQGSALLGIFGSSQPTLADCRAESLGSAAFIIEELDPQTYLCYRTNLSLPGWVQVVNFDPHAGLIRLELLTWSLP